MKIKIIKKDVKELPKHYKIDKKDTNKVLVLKHANK